MTGKGNSRPADPLAFAAQPVLMCEEPSVYGLRKLNETPAGRLVRCVDLVTHVMCVDGLELVDAARYVLKTLASVGESLELFHLRRGKVPAYARRWEPKTWHLAGKLWEDGEPVPSGYRVQRYGGERPVSVVHSSNYFNEGGSPWETVTRLEWVGDGCEPEQRQTVAEYLACIEQAWQTGAQSGSLDVHGGEFSCVAVRLQVAQTVGLVAPAAQPDGTTAPAVLSAEAVLLPADVLSLATVARLLAGSGGLLWRRAARTALARFKASDALRWWVNVPGDYPRRVGAADVWRAALPSGAELAEQNRCDDSRGVFFASDNTFTLTRADYEVRGVGHLWAYGDVPEVLVSAKSPPDLPGLPELRGPAGVLPWLVATWGEDCERLHRLEDLSEGRVGDLLLWRADVARLFLELGLDAPHASTAPAVRVGAEAVCATPPAPATETTSVRALLREAKAPGPRDADLIRLPDLAGLLACAEGLTLYEAGRLLLDALAGREKWAGLAPAGLVLYRCTVSGPVPANADLIEFEEGGQLCQFPSNRAAWLSEYRVPLVLEGDLAAVKPGAYGVPAPRFVAVVRADALRAFGLDAPALPVAPLSLGAEAAPVVPAAAPPAPAPGGGDHWLAGFPTLKERSIKNPEFCKDLANESNRLERVAKRNKTKSNHTQRLARQVGRNESYIRKCVMAYRNREKSNKPSVPEGAVSSIFNCGEKSG